MHSSSSDDRDGQQPTARPEQIQRDTEPTTPRSGLPSAPDEPVESRTEPRAREMTMRSREDTLMSTPAPADEPVPSVEDPRIAELERRVQQLEARIHVLELSSGEARRSGKRWLMWIAFMITLAVAWQLFAHFR